MKLSLKNVKDLKQKTDNILIKRVCNYVINHWQDYEDKKHIFTDVLEYGCQSGTVGELIYYSDTVKFYKQYKDEINELIYEWFKSIGTSDFCSIFGDRWDKEDPLAVEEHNQNYLAWFGFEETLRNLGRNFTVLEDYI